MRENYYSSRINRFIYIFFLVGSLVGIRKATGLRGCYGMVCIYKGFRYQNRRNGRNGKNSRDTKNGGLN